MTAPESRGDRYECVDETLGDQIWRLDEAATDAALRRRLEAHLAICAGCRLQRGLERKLAEALQTGRIELEATARSERRVWRRYLAPVGGLALAAGVTLMLLLPPRGALDELTVRGHDEARVLSPVEDQVITDRTPKLSWTAVPEAERYEVTVTAVGNDQEWRSVVVGTEIEVSPDAPLEVGRRYRVRVTPIPQYAADREATSSFRVSGWSGVLRYRATAAPPWTWWLGGLGALLLLLSLILRRTETPGNASPIDNIT